MSGSFRFVHAADLHLDTPFQGVAGPAPAVAAALQEASLQAWDNLVDLTLESEAELLLLAGDIYDGAERGVRAQLRLLRGLGRLSSAGVETFIVHGNHDPLDGWSAVREWPSGVTVFGSDGVETVGTRAGGHAVHVHGVSYGTRDVGDNLARGFRRAPGAGLNIGLLHANVGGNAEHANYAPCSLGDLDAAAMDYWALGHVHKRRLLREGTPCVAYSGNTQGRSPKPAETGPKGALVVQASGTGIEEVRFSPVDVVRFVTCAVDVGDAADVAALQAAIRDGVDAARAEHEGRSLLVRVVLEGRGAVSADVRREGALPDLGRELRDGYDGREPFVWIESVKDGSRGALDLDEIRRRGDFSAELVGLADRLAGDRDAAAAFVERAAELLARPGQVERALRKLEADLPGRAEAEATAEVLSEALLLALDGLEREAGA